MTRFAGSRPISPSTSPRRTRRACATCRRAKAWPSLLSGSWPPRRDGEGRANSPAVPQDRAGSATRPSWTTSPPRCWRQAIEGVIVSNTTLSRAGLQVAAHAGETGGLSGKPLFERSTIVLAKMRKLLGPDIADHRRRRRRFGRDGAGKDPRRRRSRAALHRHDLCRAGAAGAHPARHVDALLDTEGLQLDRRSARQPARSLGRQEPLAKQSSVSAAGSPAG